MCLMSKTIQIQTALEKQVRIHPAEFPMMKHFCSEIEFDDLYEY